MLSNAYSGRLRVMAFVDGGFLESNLKKRWGDDINANFTPFRESLLNHLGTEKSSCYIIRIYYYDAMKKAKRRRSKKPSTI